MAARISQNPWQEYVELEKKYKQGGGDTERAQYLVGMGPSYSSSGGATGPSGYANVFTRGQRGRSGSTLVTPSEINKYGMTRDEWDRFVKHSERTGARTGVRKPASSISFSGRGGSRKSEQQFAGAAKKIKEADRLLKKLTNLPPTEWASEDYRGSGEFRRLKRRMDELQKDPEVNAYLMEQEKFQADVESRRSLTEKRTQEQERLSRQQRNMEELGSLAISIEDPAVRDMVMSELDKAARLIKDGVDPAVALAAAQGLVQRYEKERQDKLADDERKIGMRTEATMGLEETRQANRLALMRESNELRSQLAEAAREYDRDKNSTRAQQKLVDTYNELARKGAGLEAELRTIQAQENYIDKEQDIRDTMFEIENIAAQLDQIRSKFQ